MHIMSGVPDSQPPLSCWYEDSGGHRLLGGTSLTTSCEPHFHETYIIAYIKRGSTCVNARGRETWLGPGSVLFANPYEIVSCFGGGGFEYDVCYPTAHFMQEAARLSGQSVGSLPLLVHSLISGQVAEDIGGVLASFGEDSGCALSTIEEELLRLIAANPGILAPAPVEGKQFSCVARACELIEELLEEPIAIADLSRQVRASRSYFVRSFRHATGLPPSDYIRQLRLARGLERIRGGLQLAEVAIISGFADQAHFTREFKRVYGTTPGKLARDIQRCRVTG